MFKNIVRILGGDPHKREIQKLTGIIDAINQLEPEYEKLSSEALRAKTDEFRQRIADGTESGLTLKEILDEILPDAFAAVREASKRTIGLRHFDVQLIGGTALHQGKIAEMRTGEGKTLVATLPLYLNGLVGRGTHLVTVNDYLARRDARWMAPIYHALGLSVGVLQMAARTENGQKAFVVDLERVSPHEDQHQLRLVDRAEAYQADITYGTNSEFGFDYLRDNLTMRLDERVQRGHFYAIVDEVDNILIDEARTPLIISGPASDDTEWYLRMAQVVRPLKPEDYEVNEKDRTVVLTELGEAHVEELLGMPFRDPERPEDITPEQARLIGYLEQALRAQFLYRRNKDYLVQSGKVVIVDEFTGRLMPGRRWSEGLHQAVEAKEGVRVEPENITYATITLQNYFRMYEKLAGMTGTALTEAEEFAKIYKLEVLPIPTNLEYVAMQRDSGLVEEKMKDEQGYEVVYYALPDDKERVPVYWRRKDFPDIVFRTEEGKLRAITREIVRVHVMGRPQLVGTTSVEHSERLSYRLQAELLRRLLQILLIRQAWIEQNKIEFVERAIPELQPLSKPLTEVDPSEIRQLARQLNISLSLDDPTNLNKLVEILELKPEHKTALTQVLQSGIPHQVLNARKHDEESQIIANAGAYGAVTIATNMAGRGVDIKLGGLMPEDILQDVIRVLGRAGQPDPYDMSNEERRQALLKMDPSQFGIYEEQVKAFFNYMEQMERVRELGGLHVVGSERHEARRIDNQLRGRSARQGDPGSSRFYLSLEDELMRLFGGQQVESLFKRLNVDENLPIEHNLVGKLVEQSQTRVEGNNFDVRKHLLEYDDVLNSQRKRIYSQRDTVFTKEDLSEDVDDMLHSELKERIPVALKDEGGPWKLLALENGAIAELNAVRLTGNSAATGGALCIVYGGSVVATHVKIDGNTATSDGGGVYSTGSGDFMWSEVSGNTSGGSGGGIYSFGIFSFNAGLIAGNTAQVGATRSGIPTTGAGGGIFNSDTLTLTNSTVANNLSSFGGGVFNAQGFVTLTGVTIAFNTSQAGGKSAFIRAQAGGLESTSSTATGNTVLRNTLIANNVTFDGSTYLPGNCGTSPQMTLQSQGNNFDSGTQCGFTSIGDQQNLDPRLSPLTFNGGSSRTVALLPTSPAIDTGNNTYCGMYDQRGYSGPTPPGSPLQRQENGKGGSGPAVCDIGAFEYHPTVYIPMVRH